MCDACDACQNQDVKTKLVPPAGANSSKIMYCWLHSGYTEQKEKKPATFYVAGFSLFTWCRRHESNTRPSHYEFSPAVQSELYRSSDERKSLSPLKFPHSAVEAVATQPPAKRAISVPELCHADRRAEPAKSRGPPVLPATRDKAQHSCFACFGAVERDSRLISPRQIFRPLAH